MTQPELFVQERIGNITREIPLAGRIVYQHPPATEGRMHFGKLATSARLQATLAVLQDGRWHTTREIRMVTDSEAVHSDMNALRYNGIAYECEPCGGKKYRYRLVTA